MQTEHLYFVGVVVAIALLVFAISDYVHGLIQGYRKKYIVRKNKKQILELLPEVVRKAREPVKTGGHLNAWNEYMSHQIERTGWKNMSATMFTVICLLMSFVGLVFGLFVFKDASVAITMTLLSGSIPFLIMSWANSKYEQRLLSQLPLAMQTFAAEFTVSKKTREALEKTAKTADSPLKGYLEKCVQGLIVNRYAENTLKEFAENLRLAYGRIWAQMMLAATKDATVVKLMPRLITRLGWQRLLIQKNTTTLSGMRRVGIILNILIIPGYFGVSYLLPETVQFYTTILGKAVIMLIFLSVTVGIVFDQWLKKIEI